MVGPLSSHILVKCYTVTPSIAITVFRKKKKKKQNTQDNFGHKVWCDCPDSCYYENICKFTRRLLWLVAQLLDWQQLIVPPKEFMVSSRQKLLTFSVFLQYIVLRLVALSNGVWKLPNVFVTRCHFKKLNVGNSWVKALFLRVSCLDELVKAAVTFSVK